MRKTTLKILISMTFLVSTISYVDVFDTLNYSGRIVNSDGSPLSGSVNLRVRFFSDSSGNDQKGSDYDFSPVLNNGVFNLEIDILDAERSTILNPNEERWIEFEDLSNAIRYPRQKLSSVPYAAKIPVRSSTFSWNGKELDLTDSCSDGQVLKYLSGSWACGSPTASAGGTIGPADIASNAIVEAKIADSAVTNVKLAGSISDTKLSDISTPGKVRNSATTATDSDTPNSIVSRNGSGNFSANQITATTFVGNLTGTATNVTGTVAVSSGGTGAANQGDARNNLGLGALATKDFIGSADIGNGAIIADDLAANSVDSTKIAVNSISLSKLNALECSNNEIIKKDAGAWVCASQTLSAGPGMTPIGSIVSVLPHIPGSWQPPASGAVKDGFMLADGSTVSDATSPLNGHVLPDMTGGVYLRGDTSSSNSPAGSNTTTITSMNLPPHIHNVDPPSTTSSNATGSTTGSFSFTDDNGSSFYVRVGNTNGLFTSSNETGHFLNSQGIPGSTTELGTVNMDISDHRHDIDIAPFDSSDGGFTNTPISTQPKNLSVVWVVRVK